MKGYYAQVVAALKAAGWTKLRAGKGSHEIWADETGKRKVTVPFNCASRHTANGVMTGAGLDKRF